MDAIRSSHDINGANKQISSTLAHPLRMTNIPPILPTHLKSLQGVVNSECEPPEGDTKDTPEMEAFEEETDMCPTCEKPVIVICDKCNKWLHSTFEELTKEEIEVAEDSNTDYICKPCTILVQQDTQV